MVQIANLVLGLEFKDLLVEVTEVGGVDVDSKPEDPAHTAIVSDATGHIRLVYRAATAVRPTQVKKGKTYLVAGVPGEDPSLAILDVPNVYYALHRTA